MRGGRAPGRDRLEREIQDKRRDRTGTRRRTTDDAPATFDRSYDTPGGETLTYVEMVSRIAVGVASLPLNAPVELDLIMQITRAT